MKYCLIGEKLGHSFSADIHRKNGLDYCLKEIKSDELGDFFSGKFGKYRGFNVTIPYKKAVMPYLDFIEEKAKKIGAVNTVLEKDGKFYGYNTDINGMEFTFKKMGVSLKDKTVMIFGSGGASQTARVFATDQGAKEVVTVSRNGAVNYENCYDIKNAEIFINATPVGMFPNNYETPFSLKNFQNAEAVFDLIYNPLKTRLILDAKKRRVKCAGGMEMLITQAFFAEKIWGYDFSEQDIKNCEIEILSQKKNVVLYGMPSSGKTTAGKAIADKLGKNFIDTDFEIEKAFGKTPSEIITESGEKTFRDIETDVIKKVAKETGAVIATGGGAVLRKENTDALKMNGFTVYIKRDISLLTTIGRPISREKGLNKLYEERKELYKNAAEITVLNNGEITDCVNEIIKKFRGSEI